MMEKVRNLNAPEGREGLESAKRILMTPGSPYFRQHYPPGAQENYNSFPSRDLIMEKGKELECSRRAGGSGIREADSDDPRFPLL
jgi:hypothetical protein